MIINSKKFINNKLEFGMQYEEIIGCNKLDLEKYIANKLRDNMTFDNYGEWEIDHIIPVSSFDFNEKENIMICFNYKNLQPLWKTENRIKYNKIPYSTANEVS